VRRAGIAKPTIIGVDDPSIIEDGPFNAAVELSSMLPPPPPTTVGTLVMKVQMYKPNL
jgi:hypothetical protein